MPATTALPPHLSPRGRTRTQPRPGRTPVRRARRHPLRWLLAAAAVVLGLAVHAGALDLPALGDDGAVAAGDGTVSVVVLDGAGVQLAASDPDGTHHAASLAKLFVVQQLLERGAAGTVDLDDEDLALMEQAVVRSDDAAMNVLWVRFGGAELVTAAAAEFGLAGTAAPQRAGQWGETTTTAADYATFLAHLGDHLPPAQLTTLTSWMRSTTPDAADGFDQSFGLLSAQADTDGPVEAKQGWMCCVDGVRELHSAGVLVDGRVVVLLGRFPEGTTWAQAQTALTDTAELVVEGG